MLSTAEASARLGISERRLRVLLNEGRVIGAQRVGQIWVIPDPPLVTPGASGPAATFKTLPADPLKTPPKSQKNRRK